MGVGVTDSVAGPRDGRSVEDVNDFDDDDCADGDGEAEGCAEPWAGEELVDCHGDPPDTSDAINSTRLRVDTVELADRPGGVALFEEGSDALFEVVAFEHALKGGGVGVDVIGGVARE